MSKRVVLLAALLGVSSTCALAQDVVMRRPLPSATGAQGTTDPGTPTPSTPVPGESTDPSTVNDPGDPSNTDFAVYQWNVGPWQGTATCGQQSKMTRSVGCQMVQPGWAVGGGGCCSIGSLMPGDVPGQLQVLQASLTIDRSQMASISSGVYDPSSSAALLRLAQFGDGGDGDVVTDVPLSYCLNDQADIGPQPANVYQGTKAGCGYTPQVTGWTEFEDPWNPGVYSGCSSQAVSNPIIQCVDSSGATVDQGYCDEALDEGGVAGSATYQPKVGNYADCTARWVGYPSNDHCEESNEVATYTYKCVRNDGNDTILTGPDESACAASDRPFDGQRSVGSCRPNFNLSVDLYCPSTKYAWGAMPDSPEPAVVIDQEFPAGTYDVGDFETAHYQAVDACLQAGATCCEVDAPVDGSGNFQRFAGFRVMGTNGTASGGQTPRQPGTFAPESGGNTSPVNWLIQTGAQVDDPDK